MTRTFVVTCRVPSSQLDELDVKHRNHTIDVEGPGFRHELELPEEADMEQLEVELDRHFLEVRAPLKFCGTSSAHGDSRATSPWSRSRSPAPCG
jgi:hypothetical protein